MPIAEIQTPDGKVISIEVPEGATEQDILNFVQSQDLSSFAQPEIQPQQEVEQNDLSTTEQIIGGISGAATLASDIVGTSVGGLTALVDVLNPFTDNDPAQMIKSIQDKLRIDPTVGGEAALNQLAELIKPAEPLINAIKQFKDEAGQQGLDLTGSPAFATFVNIIPDIIAEVGGAGLGRRLAKGSAESPTASQAKTSALSEVTKADEATGITQLTSDVLPPETRLGKLLQSQGELVAGFQRKGQQGQRVRSIENLVNKFDVAEGVGFEAKIVKGLKDSISESKKAIGVLYDESTAKLDQLGSVPLSKTKGFAQNVIDRELKKGTKANQAVIDDMKSFVDAPDDLSFELVKEIRTGVGANLEKVNRGAPVQGNTDTGLLKRTYAQLTNDMTGFAEAADPKLAANWKKANDVVSEFALGTSKRGAKSIIKNGDATPEIVDSLLFSSKNSDLEFLTSNLDSAGKQAAKQRILQRVLEKSSIDGDDINPNKFLTQLNKNRNQIGKMFNPEERKAIFALRDQLTKTRRAQDASVATPTGQQLTLGAAIALPQALIPGVIQGIIESKPIRNLLIKRKAATTAKQRVLITNEIQAEINKAGLSGAALTGAALTDEGNK